MINIIKRILPLKHKWLVGYPKGVCEYCGDKTGLEIWQLQNMPKSMAICSKGKRATVIEYIIGKYDCTT